MNAEPNYDVVIALNYYTPYVSGVTELVRVVAEGFATAGLRVVVVAGQHLPELPRRDVIKGVDVIRTPVVARYGKGIISPTFIPTVSRLGRKAKLVFVNAPMLEAGSIAASVRRTPVVTLYHCDVTLPAGTVNRVQERVLDASHRTAFRNSRKVVVSSNDYAHHSRLWPWINGRQIVIPPPAVVRAAGSPAFRSSTGTHVGFLGRIVEEKGLEYLVEGFRSLDDPEARLIIGGDFQKVAGGSVIEQVRKAIGDDERIKLLGFLPDESLDDFYASIDIFALPSVNALEAFGLVQVEAMMVGVPSLASDLAGVRMPVLNTGFGAIVPPRDPAAITAAIIELRDHSLDTAAGAAATRELYAAETVIARYLELYEELTENQ